MTEFDASSDLKGARFTAADLTGARFRNVTFVDVKIVDASIKGLEINGIEIEPLVRREIERRWPERATLKPSDPEGMRTVWRSLEERWATTVQRARALPDAALRERVEGEWSFIETLRHLTFATEAWIVRGVLGEAKPFHATSRAWDGPWFDYVSKICGLDTSADPSLDVVLEARTQRQGDVRELLANITPERILEPCPPNTDEGYPLGAELKNCTVQQCIWNVFNEEWWHHVYATRDLERIEQGR